MCGWMCEMTVRDWDRIPITELCRCLWVVFGCGKCGETESTNKMVWTFELRDGEDWDYCTLENI